MNALGRVRAAILYLRDFWRNRRAFRRPTYVATNSYGKIARSVIARIVGRGTRGYGIALLTKLPRFTLAK